MFNEEDCAEATNSLSDVVAGEVLCQQMPEEAVVDVSFQIRRDILQHLAPQYQRASSAEKNTLVLLPYIPRSAAAAPSLCAS